VVFTLRMAYQATNTPRNSGHGSLYSDICLFAADITRERTAAALRKQAEAARNRQSHRQELQDAREFAAAQALSTLKRSGNKVRRSFYFQQLGLFNPLKAKIVLKLGSNSSDSHSPASSEIGSSVSSDGAAKPTSVAIPMEDSPASEDDLPMLVDAPHEARLALFLSHLSQAIGLIGRLTFSQVSQDVSMTESSTDTSTEALVPSQPEAKNSGTNSYNILFRSRTLKYYIRYFPQ
jgi:hypothetical protein